MSKVKGTKRKSASLLKSGSEISQVKIEPGLHEQGQTNQKQTNFSSFNEGESSTSKSSSSKTEKSASSCYESTTNINVNRESSSDFSNYMKNAILEEVLNAKKAALLQSPEIVKLLRHEQLKKQRKQ